MARYNLKVLQKTLEFLYATLEELEVYAEDLSLPAVGNLQNFPRPTTAARTLMDKVSTLEEQINHSITALTVLIEMEQQKLKLPALLQESLEREVSFYVGYFEGKPKETSPIKKQNKN